MNRLFFNPENNRIKNLRKSHPWVLPNINLDFGNLLFDFSQKMKNPLILIEDTFDWLYFLSALFSRNYELVTTPNREDGILPSRKFIPNLIDSKIIITHIDGFEVGGFIKRNELTSPISIILSATKKGLSKPQFIEDLKEGTEAKKSKLYQDEEILERTEKLTTHRRQLPLSSKEPFRQRGNNEYLFKEDIFVQKIIMILEGNYRNENFGVTELGQAINLSRTQLYRKLKDYTGKSITQFIRTFRLSKAYRLLQTTNLSISEIAFKVGFKNHSYFTRVFHKEFGYTPSGIIEKVKKITAHRRQFQLSRKEIFRLGEKNKYLFKEDIFVQKIMLFLEENYGNENFGVTELGKAVNLSRTQLYRKLKAITGKSVTRFIRIFRLSKANELLQTTNLSISEIAFEVGFNNHSYFTRIFHKEFGYTPSELRHNLFN